MQTNTEKSSPFTVWLKTEPSSRLSPQSRLTCFSAASRRHQHRKDDLYECEPFPPRAEHTVCFWEMEF